MIMRGQWLTWYEKLIRDPFMCIYNFPENFVRQVNRKVCEIGVGQHAMVPYRYALIEYQPHMFTYIYEVQSKKPERIISFDALIYPLDTLSWYFTAACTSSVLLLLIFIQKCWTHASGRKPPNGWLFQGDMSCLRCRIT